MEKKGICGMCPDKCDIIVTIEEGKIVKTAPDTSSARGDLCPRGALAPQIIYSEKRITKPLIRTGEKGSGLFREASWEEAFEVTAEAFQKIKKTYGPDALASYVGGSGREGSTMRCFMGENAFFRHIGSHSDMTCSSTCNFSSNYMTPVTTYGIPTPQIVQDYENSDIIIIWGKNSKTDSGPKTTLREVKKAQARGAKIIVIDPRKQGMGELADLWIPIIPGADGALAIAMLKLIVEGKRYDEDFVREYTKGFEEFSEYLKEVSPEQFSQYCGISLSQIKELTDLFCSTEKISLISYTGLEYQLSGVQNNRAIQTLWAITGKLDVPGGICFQAKNAPTIQLLDMPKENKPIGADLYPLYYRMSGAGQFAEFPKAVLQGIPYQIKGLLLTASSPAVTYPNQKLWTEAYKNLDFMVVLDRFMTEDAKYADVVFPAATLFENQSVVSIPGGMKIRERLTEPVGEARNDVFILHGIAEKMGFGEAIPADDEELALWMTNGNSELLKTLRDHPEGITHSEPLIYKKHEKGLLRKDGKKGFPTPSGKFEISSTYIEQCGYIGYPVYEDVRNISAFGSKEEFPFMLTSGARSGVRFSSFGPVIPQIAKTEPYPTLDIGYEDAASLQIQTDDRVEIKTAFGSQTFHAKVCDMAKGAVHVPYGAGSSFMEGAWKKENINDVCSMDYHDPLSGFLLFKSIPCNINKI